MATRIPGGLTSFSRGLKYFWSDPQLEPKQQHRFVANFPVYMPGDGVDKNHMRSDSRYLAELLAGHHTEEDRAKEVSFDRRTIIDNVCAQIQPAKVYSWAPPTTRTVMIFSGRFKLIPPDISFRDKLAKSGASATEAWNQLMEATKGIHDNKWTASIFGMPSGVPPAAKKLVFSDQLYRSFLKAWDVYSIENPTISDWLRTRISPYVVTSFSPPSYGVNVGKTNIPGTSEQVADDPKNRTKMDTVTLTLVSTLQDDIHFSLNLFF